MTWPEPPPRDDIRRGCWHRWALTRGRWVEVEAELAPENGLAFLTGVRATAEDRYLTATALRDVHLTDVHHWLNGGSS